MDTAIVNLFAPVILFGCAMMYFAQRMRRPPSGGMKAFDAVVFLLGVRTPPRQAWSIESTELALECRAKAWTIAMLLVLSWHAIALRYAAAGHQIGLLGFRGILAAAPIVLVALAAAKSWGRSVASTLWMIACPVAFDNRFDPRKLNRARAVAYILFALSIGILWFAR